MPVAKNKQTKKNPKNKQNKKTNKKNHTAVRTTSFDEAKFSGETIQ